ncbi:MAG: DNA primase [Flavobacteriales bacterium]|nr:DNA primase [Flavobacteriales bacterium]
MIAQTTIDDVNALHLDKVIGRYIELKQKGTSWTALCPFHTEATASFSVTPSKGIFKCFGCGAAGNNPISFVMKKEGLDFPNAVEKLAKDNGIVIKYADKEKAIANIAKAQKRLELTELSALARDHWQANLTEADPSILRWGIETMQHWDIGFAKNEYQDLFQVLKEKSPDSLALGLLKEKNGRVYDGYRGRLMFPIYNENAQLVGFTGRSVVDDKKIPKYINSPESELYDKGALLYGLHHAAEGIHKLGKALVVEGTGDVISLHRVGATNAVAPCGTALTDEQLKLLGRYCKEITLMYDGDAAGTKAMHKNAVRAIELGFTVHVVVLPEGEDPDTILSGFKTLPYTKDRAIIEVFKDDTIDYIHYLSTVLEREDLRLRSNQLELICKLLAYNPKDLERSAMLVRVLAVSGEKSQKLTKAVNEARRLLERQKPENLIFGNAHIESQYTMPDDVGCTFNDVKEEVLKYCFFSDRNRIFVRKGDEGNYTFRKVSNFSIRIIQHMNDEKFPKRLIQIINVHGDKRTFDTSTDNFVTELAFKKMIEGHGNFTWSGSGNDFNWLMRKMKDDMGTGRMITILGQQPENIWVFNNAVIVDNEVIYLDEHGCFEHKNESYYVPSGNSIYDRTESKFSAQKRAEFIKNPYSFREVALQIKQVHRNHSINALLFTVASCFSDLIYERTSFFPLLFLYGEAGSGKDNLIEACQSFFGKPQSAMTITGKANTDKAKVRKFAQFINFVGHMTEYVPGNDDTDQMLKSFYDRVGYERGNIDSAVGTDSIPVNMSVTFTGNDYPVNDALITRFIGEEMNDTEFSQAQKDEYEKLKDMTLHGYSSLMVDILKHRPRFAEDFRKEIKAVGKELASELTHLNLADRMIQNAAVLGAVYKITHAQLKYPFTWEEFKENLKNVYERQSNKRSTGSVVAHWWECIIAAIKDKNAPIRELREFSVSGDELVIHFSSVYARYLEKHYQIFREKGLSKSVLLDKLKKTDAFTKAKNSHKFGERQSSGFVFQLEKTGVRDQFLEALSYVDSENRIAGREPASSHMPKAGCHSDLKIVGTVEPQKNRINDLPL